jgi:hypothetical protein
MIDGPRVVAGDLIKGLLTAADGMQSPLQHNRATRCDTSWQTFQERQLSPTLQHRSQVASPLTKPHSP